LILVPKSEIDKRQAQYEKNRKAAKKKKAQAPPRSRLLQGRIFPFLPEGYLAIRYGEQANEVLARYYPWIGLGLAVLIGAKPAEEQSGKCSGMLSTGNAYQIR